MQMQICTLLFDLHGKKCQDLKTKETKLWEAKHTVSSSSPLPSTVQRLIQDKIAIYSVDRNRSGLWYQFKSYRFPSLLLNTCLTSPPCLVLRLAAGDPIGLRAPPYGRIAQNNVSAGRSRSSAHHLGQKGQSRRKDKTCCAVTASRNTASGGGYLLFIRLD